MANRLDFNNYIRVEILNTNIAIEDLDMDIEINLSAEQTPNEATVRIYNLANNTKSILRNDSTGVRILYRENILKNFNVIFEGNKKDRIKTKKSHKRTAKKTKIRGSAFTEQNGSDVVTTVELGENYLNYTDTFFQKSYKTIDTKQLIREVAAKLNVGVKYIGNIKAIKYTNGVAFKSAAKNVLNDACNRMGCNWTFQNGVISVAKIIPDSGDIQAVLNQYNSSNSAPPEFEDNDEVKITTVLSTNVYPNRYISLDMNEIKGEFRVVKVEHKLSNYSAENESILTIKEVV